MITNLTLAKVVNDYFHIYKNNKEDLYIHSDELITELIHRYDEYNKLNQDILQICRNRLNMPRLDLGDWFKDLSYELTDLDKVNIITDIEHLHKLNLEYIDYYSAFAYGVQDLTEYIYKYSKYNNG